MVGSLPKNAIEALFHAVDAERLVCGGVVGLCFDDALLGDKPIVLTADRTFQRTLEHTVSLLGRFAGDGVRQHAESEGGEIYGIGWI